jgi:hypothetical protein
MGLCVHDENSGVGVKGWLNSLRGQGFRYGLRLESWSVWYTI